MYGLINLAVKYFPVSSSHFRHSFMDECGAWQILWPAWKREKRLKPSYLIEIPGFSHQVGSGGRLREQMGFWMEWSLVVSQPGFPRVPTLLSFWEGERENPILHLSAGPFPSCWHSRRVSPIIFVTNSNGYRLFKSPRAVSVPHLLRSSPGEIWTRHELI